MFSAGLRFPSAKAPPSPKLGVAALGDAEAVPSAAVSGKARHGCGAAVCEGLRGWGLDLDTTVNEQVTAEQVRITTSTSRLHAWAMPVKKVCRLLMNACCRSKPNCQ